MLGLGVGGIVAPPTSGWTAEMPAQIGTSPVSARGEYSVFDAAKESLFGDPYSDPDRWQPLSLGTLLTEGWDEPWISPPKGGGGARHQAGAVRLSGAWRAAEGLLIARWIQAYLLDFSHGRGPVRALSGRYIREERAEALRHCRVRDDRVAQARVRHAGQHRGLNHGHDFARLGAEHGETQNAVAVGLDQCLQEAARLRDCPRSQHGDDRQLRDTNGDALALGLAFE